MTQEFLEFWLILLISSQCVFGPIHNHGHMLDFVFSLEIKIENIWVEETAILDQVFIGFNLTLRNILPTRSHGNSYIF